MERHRHDSALLRVIALGDCVGKPGRRALKDGLRGLRERFKADLVVANIENATNGWGIRRSEFEEILAAGVDLCTSGDHVADRPEVIEILGSDTRLIRPYTYNQFPGKGTTTLEVDGVVVGLANIPGKVFMPPPGPKGREYRARPNGPDGKQSDSVGPLSGDEPPADGQEGVLHWCDQACTDLLKAGADILLFDVHAEATAEKVASGWYMDGRASALWGTHTHVQTSDAQVLPQGCGYLTDLGFCGGHQSVLGRDVERVFNRLLGRPRAYMEVAAGWPQLDGAFFEIDVKSKRCVRVELIRERTDVHQGR